MNYCKNQIFVFIFPHCKITSPELHAFHLKGIHFPANNTFYSSLEMLLSKGQSICVRKSIYTDLLSGLSDGISLRLKKGIKCFLVSGKCNESRCDFLLVGFFTGINAKFWKIPKKKSENLKL